MKKENISGLIACFALAVVSYLLGKQVPIVGGPVFAIILGIAIATMVPNVTKKSLFGQELAPGIKYSSKKILHYSIIFLGFEMNMAEVIRVGSQSLYIMIFTLTAALISAWIMGRVLGLSRNTTILVGVGTSICGGSAIAATAPVINAKDEDVSKSISTIFLFNIVAVFLFPALGHMMNMNDVAFGMWAGTAINDTSSVVAASASWSTEALQLATIVKLTRTLMIVPITLALAIWMARNESKKEGAGFSIGKVFPMFVIYFLVASLVNTFVLHPYGFATLASNLTALGKFLIIVAMSAIGLNTSLTQLFDNGIKPVVLGLTCWFCVAIVGLIVQYYIGLL